MHKRYRSIVTTDEAAAKRASESAVDRIARHLCRNLRCATIDMVRKEIILTKRKKDLLLLLSKDNRHLLLALVALVCCAHTSLLQ
jgi:hypothetical protein